MHTNWKCSKFHTIKTVTFKFNIGLFMRVFLSVQFDFIWGKWRSRPICGAAHCTRTEKIQRIINGFVNDYLPSVASLSLSHYFFLLLFESFLDCSNTTQRKQFAIIYGLMYLMELCDVIAGTHIDSRHNSVNHQ